MNLQPAIIDAAIAGGVKHFYPSEWGTDLSQPEIAEERYFRDKQTTRAHLVSAAKQHPDFKYTLMLNAQFTESIISSFFGFDNEKNELAVYGDPNARVGCTALPE